MGGKLIVESEIDEGTTIKFDIDLEISYFETNNQKQLQRASTKSVSKDFDFKTYKFLIVEDMDLNVKVLIHFLNKTNPSIVNIDVAGDGKIGLELYKQKHHDFVFMDLVCFFWIFFVF